MHMPRENRRNSHILNASTHYSRSNSVITHDCLGTNDQNL